MSAPSLKSHLTPETLARRQKWVVVGVAVLGALFVATWLYGLPTRLGMMVGSSQSILGDMPKTQFIDIKEYIGGPDDVQITKMIDTINALSASSTVKATTSTQLSPEALEILKKKLK